ncbi:MAG: glycosidase [Kiritimatiellia bacterium]
MRWASLATALCLNTVACAPKTPPKAAATQQARARAIYFLMIDRFENGDPNNDSTVDRDDPQAFHGGDLSGVQRRLNWIEGLGFTDVWLTPVFEMRTEKLDKWGAYHGYWVRDLSSVEPRFGTEAELAGLSDALHHRQMGLWLDMVWNHVGFDAPLRTQHPDWFHPALPITDWDDDLQVQTHEVHGLPDLAQERPEVYEHLLATSKGWSDRVHPDGLRIDAVRHMPVDVQARLATDLRANDPDLELLGEVFDGDPARLQASWAGTGYDHVFDFPLRYAIIDTICHRQPVGRLASVFSQDATYGDARQLVTFLDNHDTSRIMHECGGDVNRVDEALKLLLSVRGIPSITWGTEVGMDGAEEPANRADMRFISHPLQATIRTSLARRARMPALHAGRTEVVDLQANLLVLAQISDDQSALVALNHTGADVVWRGLSFPVGLTVHDEPIELKATELRTVEIDVEGDVLVGAGEALGGWRPDRGVPIVHGVARVTVPTRTVLSYKVVRRGDDGWVWTEGDNTYLFVSPKPRPLEPTDLD